MLILTLYILVECLVLISWAVHLVMCLVNKDVLKQQHRDQSLIYITVYHRISCLSEIVGTRTMTQCQNLTILTGKVLCCSWFAILTEKYPDIFLPLHTKK